MNAVRKFLVDTLAAVWRPVARMRLEEWGEANIVLSSKESIDNPGPYQRHHAVYAPRLLDEFMGNPEWRTLVVQKSSQSGFTLHVLILICRLIAEVATNILYVINSVGAARKLSKTRLKPMLGSCKATRIAVVENEDDMSNLEYNLPGGILSLIGAGSAGAFASNPYGFVAFDEMDKAKEFKVEASGWELALNRIKRTENGKAVGFSTPTEETGLTHQGFKTGSQHRYFVPCPHCHEMQTLEWKHVRFIHCKDKNGSFDLQRMLADTFYECPHCHGKITDDHKVAMNLAGEWRPTNFKEVDGKRVPAWNPFEMSAQISDLYSTHPNSSFGFIAVQFIQAQGNTNKMQDWENGRMGQPVKRTVSNINHRHVLRLRGAYQKGNLPFQPCCTVAAIDNQDGFQKWARVGFLPNGTFAVVDWGKSMTLESAEELVLKPIPTPAGSSVPQRIAVDEGGKGGTSYEVRTFCFPRFPVFFPVKGSGGEGRHTISWSDSALYRGGLDKIPVCHFNDDSFKRELYMQFIKGFDPQKAADYPDKPRMWIPVDADEQFVAELCAEQLVRELDANGQPKFVWKTSPPNDWGDCVKMCLVVWNNIGHLFQPKAPI